MSKKKKTKWKKLYVDACRTPIMKIACTAMALVVLVTMLLGCLLADVAIPVEVLYVGIVAAVAMRLISVCA